MQRTRRVGLAALLLAGGLGLLVGALETRLGLDVSWLLGLVYGLAIVLATGAPFGAHRSAGVVTITGGLFIAGMWSPQPLVVLAAILLASAYLALRSPRNWFLAAQATGLVAVGVTWFVVIAGDRLGFSHAAWATLCAAAYWLALRSMEVLLRRPEGYFRELGALLASTWWSVPLYVAVALGLDALRPAAGLEAAAALAIAQIQLYAAPAVNALLQDLAARELIVRMDTLRTAQPGHYERVFRFAHALGPAAGLGPEERRLLGYACVLQDVGSADRVAESAETGLLPPGADQRPALAERVRRATELIRRVPALEPVAAIIQHRFAWWDGSGSPAAGGAEITPAAQVLAAANGLARLTAGGKERHLAWLRAQRGRRLDPALVAAMEPVLAGPAAGAGGLLPETLERLQALGRGGSWWPARVLDWFQRRWPDVIRPPAVLPQPVRAVAQFCSVVAACTDLEAVTDVVLRTAVQLTGGRALLALAGEAEGPFLVQAARGFRAADPRGAAITLGGGPAGRALLRGDPYHWSELAPDTKGPALDRLIREEGIRSALLVPLFSRGRTLGLLLVGWPSPRWVPPRLLGLLQMVAGQAALAVDNIGLLAQAGERLERVAAMHRFTHVLIETLQAGLVVVDPDRRVTLINRMGRRLLEQAVGRSITVGDLCPAIPHPEAPLARALTRGESSEGFLWEVRPDFTLEVNAAPLKDAAGTLLGAVALARDVTAVRRMEEEVRRVERLAAIGQLAAGAAHEIRNPLAAIRGFIQLLGAAQTPGSAHAEYSRISLDEIDRLDRLVRDLLLLGRPVQPQRQPVRLHQFLEDVLLLCAQDLTAGGITVERLYDESAPPADADPKMLKQVAHNLVRNAMEAMPGGGRLTVSCGGGDGKVWFRVADSGPGLTPEQRAHLFLPFFTTKEQGTGLGLAICHAIVGAHGGSIAVEQSSGKGAAFQVTLDASSG